MKTEKLDHPLVCPECGKAHTEWGSSVADESARPKPGAIGICTKCACTFKIDQYGVAHRLQKSELKGVSLDTLQHIADTRKKVIEYIKKRKTK